MKARMHTQRMLDWWRAANIHQADLMVKRAGGTTIQHANILLQEVPLPWLKAENASGADIYVRPTRNLPCPMLFLDDVHPKMAIKIATKYAILTVRTSPQGGCHLWLLTTEPLCEVKRGKAQHYLAQRVGADMASTSGEHFGRLAGMKNWKRGGVWVNAFRSDPAAGIPWNPAPAWQTGSACTNQMTASKPTWNALPATKHGSIDQSQSGQEWGWVRGAIEAGLPPEKIFSHLLQHARPRRGQDVERYAMRTIQRALQKTD